MSTFVRLASASVIVFAAATQGFAADATVYCKPDDSQKVIDVLSEDGFECIGSLSAGGYGTACFAGDRDAAIEILNGREVEALFDGTDGESIRDARAEGGDAIIYTYVDEVNAYEEDIAVNRCAEDFATR